jgi:hypothetical protein
VTICFYTDQSQGIDGVNVSLRSYNFAQQSSWANSEGQEEHSRNMLLLPNHFYIYGLNFCVVHVDVEELPYVA